MTIIELRLLCRLTLSRHLLITKAFLFSRKDHAIFNLFHRLFGYLLFEGFKRHD